MTERLAADAIVAAVVGIAETQLEQGAHYGRRFTHDPTLGRSDRRGRARTFNLLSDGGAKDYRRNGRMQQEYTLLVDYAAKTDEYELDRVMHRDADRLSQTLSQPGAWGTSSTICQINPEGGFGFPYSIDVIDEGDKIVGLRLIMQFTAIHTGQTVP